MINNDIMHAVITTIAKPTDSVRALAERLFAEHAKLIVIGDRKGPLSYDLPGATFLSLKDQLASPFTLAQILPTGHYARKNLGYLCAMKNGARCIYETDDDNAPLPVWGPRSETLTNIRSITTEQENGSGCRWVNVYRFFTNQTIWPRGLPLDQINVHASAAETLTGTINAPIQQGLVNNSPDVDAIWRLTQDRPFSFDVAPSVLLPRGHWCPFNTQSTWWWPEAFPLMYIPSHCSFRMCDIWKSFVAQRCLWELEYGLVFHASEVIQDRNVHNLIKDFEDEIPGYVGNSRLAQTLADLSLASGPGNAADNLLHCYEAMVEKGFLPQDELSLVRAWIADVEGIPSSQSITQ